MPGQSLSGSMRGRSLCPPKQLGMPNRCPPGSILRGLWWEESDFLNAYVLCRHAGWVMAKKAQSQLWALRSGVSDYLRSAASTPPLA